MWIRLSARISDFENVLLMVHVGGVHACAAGARYATFFFGPGLDLKLHPGVHSSRNSMKVLTARTDVSYLRDYKTGGEEGYAGRFCAFRVFLFFSNPASPISPVHSLCLSVGVCGTSGSKRPYPLLCKFTLAGYINAGSGWPPYAMMGARTRSITGQRSGQSRSADATPLGYGVLPVRTSMYIPKRKGEAQLSVQHGAPRERCCDPPRPPLFVFLGFCSLV